MSELENNGTDLNPGTDPNGGADPNSAILEAIDSYEWAGETYGGTDTISEFKALVKEHGGNADLLKAINEFDNKQAEKIRTEAAAKAKADETAATQARDKAAAALRSEWGGEYEHNMKQTFGFINTAVGKLGVDAEALMAEIDATGIGNNPAFIKLFHHIASVTADDDLGGNSGGGGKDAPTDGIKWGAKFSERYGNSQS